MSSKQTGGSFAGVLKAGVALGFTVVSERFLLGQTHGGETGGRVVL